MDIYSILRELDSEHGVSGNEYNIANVVKSMFSKYCDEVYTDKLGNVVGKIYCNKENAKLVMIEAHMDEIGLIVSGYADEGSLLFQELGGFDPKVLLGAEVTVHGKENMFGVIGAKPPHLVSDRTKVPEISEMAIDIGLGIEKTKKYVSVGDIVSINTRYTKLMGSFVAGRCLDDRAGIAAIIKTMDMIKSMDITCDVAFVATVQEEVGLRGARVSAQSIAPDAAISIDVTHGEAPGVSDDAFKCGEGTVITVGANLHPKLNKMLFECAKKEKIDIQIEAEGGNTGTNAWEIQIAGMGVPVALLSVPLRYMHANYEVIDVTDVESTAKLIAAFLSEYKDGDALCY